MSLSYRLGPNRTRWDWGRIHAIAFVPFTGSGESIGPVPLGGDRTTLSFAASDGNDRFKVRAASTYRVVIDLSGSSEMLSALAPGQSEHPLHPHFADGLEAWREGRSALLVNSPLLVEETSPSRLVLVPAS